ncbi:MAG: sugar phosphate isomerase/epimerase [Acidobacteria bacterium]|nr:sugar phosphate isomerase/epimerase [Acidobacteriota bacterium]MBI3658040.1 sugar phosphate isomerase/epimerase [Acidobacteriota bacterium]
MKIAYSSNGFRRHGLPETIRRLAEIGYDGVEIMADTPHAYPPHLTPEAKRQIKAALQETGLAIANVNAFMMCAVQDFHHPSWIEPEKKRRQLRIQHTVQCIELAAELGAKSISTEPGGPLEDMPPEAAMEFFIEGIDQVVPIARQAGVRILIEPEPGLLIQTSSQFLAFIGEVDSNVVGVNCDVGHFYCVQEDPAEVIVKLKEHIGHFHMEDIAETREHVHRCLGEGAMDFPKIIQVIRDIGYDSFLTIELYPYQENAPEVAAKSLAYLRNLLF